MTKCDTEGQEKEVKNSILQVRYFSNDACLNWPKFLRHMKRSNIETARKIYRILTSCSMKTSYKTRLRKLLFSQNTLSVDRYL